ncbi:MAG: anhydro-N-acetylmuramic acid kinase [Pseudomonadota bacterium]
MHDNIYTAIGLMSGTSTDGIDAAIIKTDGYKITEYFESIFIPYQEDFRRKLQNLMNKNANHLALEQEFTELNIKAVIKILQLNKMSADDIDLIGFHGQTITHQPAEGITWQIGNSALLAEKTGINVIGDMRRRDVAAGGQGAPLVPIFHHALFNDYTKPLMVVNIGGVANITYISEDEDALMACDTGPGNALIDDFIFSKTGQKYDEGGQLALKGSVNFDIINEIMTLEYFKIPPPKSLDRHDFSDILPLVNNLSTEDAVATLSYFTAKTIADSAKFAPEQPTKWIICGGGRHNKFIMEKLNELLDGVVDDIDQHGLSGDYIEAQAFAFLAVRSFKKLPITFPKTTGIARAISGGSIYSVR